MGIAKSLPFYGFASEIAIDLSQLHIEVRIAPIGICGAKPVWAGRDGGR